MDWLLVSVWRRRDESARDGLAACECVDELARDGLAACECVDEFEDDISNIE
jgi:hypothetical protein